jgi:hypothetical protein
MRRLGLREESPKTAEAQTRLVIKNRELSIINLKCYIVLPFWQKALWLKIRSKRFLNSSELYNHGKENKKR